MKKNITLLGLLIMATVVSSGCSLLPQKDGNKKNSLPNTPAASTSPSLKPSASPLQTTTDPQMMEKELDSFKLEDETFQ